MDQISEALESVKNGFLGLKVDSKYKESARAYIEEWLKNPEFGEYAGQIRHLIAQEDWDYLLDCFYQIIPFGTAGRRGEVGVGPNRINLWTVCSASQGHSQYLVSKYGNEAKKRGVAIAYDVRIFLGNRHLNPDLKTPLTNLSAKDLAEASARVYAANGMKVYIFDGIRTTPELSFTIRHLKTVAGAMYSASHNPPDHNGQKVFDEYGGQLIPPYDEELVKEVTQNVKEIKFIDYNQGRADGLINPIGNYVDKEYIKAVLPLSRSKARAAKIVYTPLHGCGITSVPKVMESLGFSVILDPKTANPSGRFENVTFNIPNPEVVESFDASLECAKKENADILLNSDPDADRIGVMVKHGGEWKFLNGDQIYSILAGYAEEKTRSDRKAGIMIKTAPTTGLAVKICQANNIELIGDLLVGYKYIANTMNRLEREGRIGDFLFAGEESYGYSSGNYIREKDACLGAIWLSELTAELKLQGKTVVDYLDDIYARYGYFYNHQTEIRMLGAAGFDNMRRIMDSLRANPPATYGRFAISSIEDGWSRLPFVSMTDKISKNMLVFNIKPADSAIDSMRLTIRPSGTEPKLKIYFEVGAKPTAELEHIKNAVADIAKELEREAVKTWCRIVGVELPDRAFLLFWQVPLEDKMEYFKIEPRIEALRDEPDTAMRQKKLAEILVFLGPGASGKINKAFAAKYGATVEEYLSLQ